MSNNILAFFCRPIKFFYNSAYRSMCIKATIVAYAFSVQYFENATIVAYAGLRVKYYINLYMHVCIYIVILLEKWDKNRFIDNHMHIARTSA